MWIYDQSSGTISHNGANIGTGYSGHQSGKNNPAMENVKGVGPIPIGKWHMDEVRENGHTGPFSIVLSPEPGTETFGRSEFLIHGDSVQHPGDASHGCIILPHFIRTQIWDSGDRLLEVVA